MSDPIDNIKMSLAYATKKYAQAGMWARGYQVVPPEKAARLQKKINAAQPWLRAVAEAYDAIVEEDSLVGKIARLHMPRFDHPRSTSPHCEGCPGDDMGFQEWPCETAQLIANERGINLDDMWMYRWEERA